MIGRTLAFLAVLTVARGAAHAQSPDTGFLNRTVTVDGENYRYQVYVPADYETESAWPVILFLHGAGERGADGLVPTTVGLAPAIRRAPDRYPAIVVFPQVPDDSEWNGTPADLALAALRQTLDEFATDSNRVYLTGLSMGGNGTWYLAYRHPEIFAAVVPICGWIPEYGRFSVVPEADGLPLPAVARRLRHTPVWIFHGEMDGVVSVEESRQAAEALKAVSANVRYTEYLGVDHNSWDATYASDVFVKWLFEQRR